MNYRCPTTYFKKCFLQNYQITDKALQLTAIHNLKADKHSVAEFDLIW